MMLLLYVSCTAQLLLVVVLLLLNVVVFKVAYQVFAPQVSCRHTHTKACFGCCCCDILSGVHNQAHLWCVMCMCMCR